MSRRLRVGSIALAVLLLGALLLRHPSVARAEGAEDIVWISTWEELEDNLVSPPAGATIALAEDILCPEPTNNALLSVLLFDSLTIDGNGKTLSGAALSIMVMGGALRIENLDIRLSYDDAIPPQYVAVVMLEWGTLELHDVSILPQGGEHVAISGIHVANGATLISGGCQLSGGSIHSDIAPAGHGLHLEGSYDDRGGNTYLGGGNQGSGGAGAGIYAKNTAISLQGGLVESGGQAPALWLSGGSATLSGVSLKSYGQSPAIHTESPADTVTILDGSVASTWPLILQEHAQRVQGVATEVSIPAPLTLTQGDVLSPELVCAPVGASPIVRWESSDPSIVAIGENGTFHALAAGDATLTAHLPGGEQYSFAATVTEKPPGPTDPGGETDPSGPLQPLFPLIHLPDIELVPPEPFTPSVTAMDFYSFRQDTPILASPSAGALSIGMGPEGDFAVARALDAASGWVEIALGGESGFVPAETLEHIRCTLEYAAQPATFVELDALYDAPGGDEITPIAPGIPVQSLLTRGEWTALFYQGDIVYAPAENLRLLSIDDCTVQTEVKTPLHLEPYAESLTLTVLWVGVKVLFIPGDDSEEEWLLVQVGMLFGYVRVESLRWDVEEVDSSASGDSAWLGDSASVQSASESVNAVPTPSSLST